jgi:hypothetical protein
MKIEPGTIITAILFLLVCSIPFILLGRNARKREKQFLNMLTAVAEKNNCSISQHNFWGHAAIGIDEAAQMVFFTKKTPEMETGQRLSLHEIQKCRVINTSRTERNDGGNFTITDKLELAFAPKDRNKTETAFTFYDATHDGANLTGELQLAEKWCRIINDKIGVHKTK